QGDTEIQLAAIWQELLGAERIGRDDSFFELGGHSLLAARAAARINAASGIELPLRTFFEAPELAAAAARIEAEMAQGSGRKSGAIERVSRSGELPLSHAQRRLWFLDRLESGSSAYV